MMPTFHSTNEYGPTLVENLRKAGIDVQFIPNWTRFLPLLEMLRASDWQLPHIVHLQWIDTYTIKPAWWQSVIASTFYIWGLLILKTLGVKIVWTIHDYFAYHDNDFTRLDIKVRRLTARLADAIIIHSETGRNKVTELYRLDDESKQKINCIPLGHYIGRYPNTLSQAECKKRLGVDANAFLFGFVGYISPYKGLPHLIQTFRQIKNENTRLLIAGMPFDASFGQTIAKEAAQDNRIYLYLRFIENVELQVFLNASDVVVLPFTHGIAASSLMLAMSFAKAIVASSNIASAAEVLPPQGGLIYESKDSTGLFKALEEIQTMDTFAMGQKNLEHVQAFDWQSIAHATLQIYQRVSG